MTISLIQKGRNKTLDKYSENLWSRINNIPNILSYKQRNA